MMEQSLLILTGVGIFIIIIILISCYVRRRDRVVYLCKGKASTEFDKKNGENSNMAVKLVNNLVSALGQVHSLPESFLHPEVSGAAIILHFHNRN